MGETMWERLHQNHSVIKMHALIFLELSRMRMMPHLTRSVGPSDITRIMKNIHIAHLPPILALKNKTHINLMANNGIDLLGNHESRYIM